MTNTTWAEWLRTALQERGWRQARLVAESEGEIKADRVSKWLAGKEKPSHRLAAVTANVLGVSRDDALRAAGFAELVDPAPTPTPALPDISAVPDEVLLEELLQRARTRASGSVTSILDARSRRNVSAPTDDDLQAVARSIDEDRGEDQ